MLKLWSTYGQITVKLWSNYNQTMVKLWSISLQHGLGGAQPGVLHADVQHVNLTFFLIFMAFFASNIFLILMAFCVD